MKVLIDTDVILDLVLEREPFSEDAKNIWNANAQGLYEGYVSAITPINVHYFVRKFKDAKVADQVVQEILNNLQICPIDYAVLQSARISAINDFEDAVQHSSAQNLGLDAIITRNIKDYTKATLQIFTPSDFLKTLT
jgi:predicted nucleic acid-binding protein